VEICHKNLSEQDGIREQDGILLQKIKSMQDVPMALLSWFVAWVNLAQLINS